MNIRAVLLTIGYALLAIPAGAQSSKDSAHVKAQRQRLDSAKTALDSLRRWCNVPSYTSPRYLRRVCGIAAAKPDIRARAAEDSLLIAPQPPPPPANAKPQASFTVSWSGTTATLTSTSTDDQGIASCEFRAPGTDRPTRSVCSTTRGYSATDQPYTEWLIVKDAAGLVDSTSQEILGPPSQPPPPVDTSTPPPPPPPPTGATAIITTIAGSPIGAHAGYDAAFNKYFPKIDSIANINRLYNYYDRAKAYYARFVRTGDPRFLALGHEIVLAYRQGFLEPNNYGTQPHNVQMIGLELHYRLTGDTLSRRAVAGTFAYSLESFARDRSPAAHIANTSYASGENRIQARVLQGALSSYRMGASFRRHDGPVFLASEWPARLRDYLNKILSTQNSDGSYSWVQICGGQLNYMVGMLNDVLIEYHRDFEQDPRIPVAIEKANEYLWTTQWRPADGAFNYASVPCSPNQFGTNVGGMTAAGDLNGLILPSFGWLSTQTGDPKWRTRGDAILAGLVSTRWATNYTGNKQFNQAFAESYRYLAWR